MRNSIIRAAELASLAVLLVSPMIYAADEPLSPAMEKRLQAIEKRIEATQQTFDQILKGIDDVLWFERVGDIATVDKVYIASVPNPKAKEIYEFLEQHLK